ncbi:MAG: substrate-binding periplasmic protein [Spirochaetota bacterium]
MNNSEEGFLIAITRMIFEDAGIPYRFEKLPVNRIFENLKNPGKVCMAGLFKNPEREKLYVFSSGYIYQDSPPHYVVHRRNFGRFAGITTINSLLTSKMTLGKVDRYSYGLWVDANLRRYNPPTVVVNVGDNQGNFFNMLLLGRFDYLFAGQEEASYNLHANPEFRTDLAILTLRDAPAGNRRYIAFSKGFPPADIRRINASISRVKNKAEYMEIVKKAKNVKMQDRDPL